MHLFALCGWLQCTRQTVPGADTSGVLCSQTSTSVASHGSLREGFQSVFISLSRCDAQQFVCSGEGGLSQGLMVSIAIGLHNIPEGLAVATVIRARSSSSWKALMWSIITALPQALVAVPSFLFVELFQELLPAALGFAAGCMIWIVFAELMPEALEQTNSSDVTAIFVTLSATG